MATFQNQATLSYNGTTTTSNVVVGRITPVLTAAKHAPIDTYQTGDRLTYVISIVNSGTAAITNLTVTDDLGGYPFGTETLYPLTYVEGSVALYQDGVLQGDPTVTAGPPLVFTGITVPAGGNVLLIYAVTVNEFADPSDEGVITNTATISGGGINTPITVTETVRGESGLLLTITKGISPVPVVENGRLTYTFRIENFGSEPAVATDNVVVTDLFDPILSDLVVTFNGALWTAPAQYTYNQATGLFTTQIGAITVPAATFTRDPVTGEFTIVPGVATLVVTGTV